MRQRGIADIIFLILLAGVGAIATIDIHGYERGVKECRADYAGNTFKD
jgi:hypothetical protein